MTRKGGLLLTLVLMLGLALGCGRPTRPGAYFEGQKVETSVAPRTDTPLPEKPFIEFGPEEAKVRILAFFPIDDPHQELISLLKALAKEYPGKVYVKYVDPRTSEGRVIMERSRMMSWGLMINGQTEMVIHRGPQAVPTERPRPTEFVQDMGRYWTADDLRAAVAQTVKQVYGGKR